MTRAAYLIVALVACRNPTEIVVTLDTNYGVPCAIDSLHVVATGSGGSVSEDVSLTNTSLPGSITLTPKDEVGPVSVTVTAMRQGMLFATATTATTCDPLTPCAKGEDCVAGKCTFSFEDHGDLELRFVIDDTCIKQPCGPVGIGGYRALPKPVVHHGCGTEAYAVQATADFVLRDACDMQTTPTVVLQNVDAAESALALDPSTTLFPFNFYGHPVSGLWIGTNGYLGFGNTQPNAQQAPSSPLGVGTFPTDAALVFWDKLWTGPTGVCVTESGTFPNRLLWITWKNACIDGNAPCGPTPQSVLTFSAALEETTDRIYFGYEEMAPAGRATGANATIGIVHAGTPGCTSGCGSDGRCADGTPCGYTQYSTAMSHPDITTTTLEFDPQ
jgi:hypothetical protein